ncbi:unnamed protein product [Amoebophrya sp. A120]|nr:unnamed protein product [Amoebophrya sp. A120]|eukprot:GSA120T00007140001.1
MDGQVKFRLLKQNMTKFIEDMTSSEFGRTEKSSAYFLEHSTLDGTINPFAVEAVQKDAFSTSVLPAGSESAYGQPATTGESTTMFSSVLSYFSPDGESLDTTAQQNLWRKNFVPKHSDVLFVDKILVEAAKDEFGTDKRVLGVVDAGKTELDLGEVDSSSSSTTSGQVEPIPVLASYNPYGHSLTRIVDHAATGDGNHVAHSSVVEETATPFLPNLFLSALTSKGQQVSSQPYYQKADLSYDLNDFYQTKVRILEITDEDYSVKNLQFLDEDYQTGLIKGKLTWELLHRSSKLDKTEDGLMTGDETETLDPATDYSKKQYSNIRYDIFLGDFNAESVQRYIGSAYNGSTAFTFEYNTYLTSPRATVVTVKIGKVSKQTSGTSNNPSKRIKSNGLSVSIFDQTSTVSNLLFKDLNPNYGYISGLLQWSNPLIRKDLIPHCKVEIYQADNVDAFGDLIRPNLVAELDYASLSNQNSLEGMHFIGLESLKVEQLLVNASASGVTRAFETTTDPSCAADGSNCKEFTTDKITYEAYNFTPSGIAGETAKHPRYTAVGLNPDVGYSRRHTIPTEKKSYAIIEDLDSANTGPADFGKLRENLKTGEHLFNPKVSLLHQNFFAVRIADKRTNHENKIPTDSFSTTEVYDVVKNLVADLQFEDFDLRKDFIAGDVTFSYMFDAANQHDPEDYLKLYFSESANLNYKTVFLEPTQFTSRLTEYQTTPQTFSSSFGFNTDVKVMKQDPFGEDYDKEIGGAEQKTLKENNNFEVDQAGNNNMNLNYGGDGILQPEYQGHRHPYEKPRILDLSKELIGKVRKPPVQLPVMEKPKWAKYLILASNKERRAYSAIPLLDVSLELEKSKRSDLWSFTTSSGTFSGDKLEKLEEKLNDLANAGLPGVKDSFERSSAKTKQSQANLFYDTKHGSVHTRSRSLREVESRRTLAASDAPIVEDSVFKRPAGSYQDKWTVTEKMNGAAISSTTPSTAIYNPQKFLYFDQQDALTKLDAFSFMSFNDRNCEPNQLNLLVTIQNFAFLEEKIDRLYFVVEESIENSGGLKVEKSTVVTSSLVTSPNTAHAHSSSENKHSTNTPLSCRATSARACGDAVRSRYQELVEKSDITSNEKVRVIRTNGIPNHLYGQNPAAPNEICEQPREYKLKLKPVRISNTIPKKKTPLGVIGVLRTGAFLYNPFANREGSVAFHPSNELQFLDNCAGHADEQCVYHHHFVNAQVRACSFDCFDRSKNSRSSTSTRSSSSSTTNTASISTLSSSSKAGSYKKSGCNHVGWLLDGFPVYANCDHALFKSCYYLKTQFSNFDFNAHDAVHASTREIVKDSMGNLNLGNSTTITTSLINNDTTIFYPDNSMQAQSDSNTLQGDSESDYIYRGVGSSPNNMQVPLGACHLDEANGFDFTSENFVDVNEVPMEGYGYVLTENYPYVPMFYSGDATVTETQHLPHSKSIPMNQYRDCHPRVAELNPFRSNENPAAKTHVTSEKTERLVETTVVSRIPDYEKKQVPEDSRQAKRKQIVVKKVKKSELNIVDRNELFYTAEVEINLPTWSNTYSDLVLYATNARMLAGNAKVQLARKRIKECDRRFTLRDLEFLDEDPDLHEVGGKLSFKFPPGESEQLKSGYGDFPNDLQTKNDTVPGRNSLLEEWMKTYADLLRAEDQAKVKQERGSILPLFAPFQSSTPLTNPRTFYGPMSPESGEFRLATGLEENAATRSEFDKYKSKTPTFDNEQNNVEINLQKAKNMKNVFNANSYKSSATWESIAKDLVLRVLFVPGSDMKKVENQYEQVMRLEINTTKQTIMQHSGYDSSATMAMTPIPRFNETVVFDDELEQQKLLIKPMSHDESMFDSQEYPTGARTTRTKQTNGVLNDLVSASVSTNKIVKDYEHAVVLEYAVANLISTSYQTDSKVEIAIPPNTPVIYGSRSTLSIQLVHKPRNVVFSEQPIPVRDYFDKATAVSLDVSSGKLKFSGTKRSTGGNAASSSSSAATSTSTQQQTTWQFYTTNCLFERPFEKIEDVSVVTSTTAGDSSSSSASIAQRRYEADILNKIPPHATRILILAESETGQVEQSKYGMRDFFDLLNPENSQFGQNTAPTFASLTAGNSKNASNFLIEEVITATSGLTTPCRPPDVANVIPSIKPTTYESKKLIVSWPTAVSGLDSSCGGPSGFRLYLTETADNAAAADFQEVWPSYKHTMLYPTEKEREENLIPDCALRGPRKTEFVVRERSKFDLLLGKTFNGFLRSYSFKAKFTATDSYYQDSVVRELKFMTLPAQVTKPRVVMSTNTVVWSTPVSWGGSSSGLGFRVFRDMGRNSTSATAPILAEPITSCGTLDETATNCTLTGLTANELYQVRVAAYSEVGQGPFSPRTVFRAV